MKTVIGIDGGATSTRALIANERGEVLAYRTAGGSNPRTVGFDAARRNLATVTAGHQAAVAFLGLAGVSEPEDREPVLRLAVELGFAPAGMVGVDHDIRIALAGGLAGDSGIVVIAGTGAACYGRSASGEVWRAGGWDWEADNHGGAHRVAVAGMEAVLRAFDGRGPVTSLTGKFPERRDFQRMTKSEVAALAPVVLAAAEAGDAVAIQIVERQTDELACAVAAVAQRLNMPAGPVTYTGSLLLKSESYRAAFTTAVRRRLPGASVTEPVFSPVVGAVLLGWQLAGWPVTAEVLANLREFCVENF